MGFCGELSKPIAVLVDSYIYIYIYIFFFLILEFQNSISFFVPFLDTLWSSLWTWTSKLLNDICMMWDSAYIHKMFNKLINPFTRYHILVMLHNRLLKCVFLMNLLILFMFGGLKFFFCVCDGFEAFGKI